MIFQNYCTNISKPYFMTYVSTYHKKLHKDKYFLAMVDYPPSKNKYSVIRKDNVIADKVENTARRVLISPNFLVRLLNNYWQETIFLSKFNSVSEAYINQLKSDGITLHKSQYKKFLGKFSKALVTGRVEASFSNKENYLPVHEVKYVWRKGLNFSLPGNLLESIVNQKNSKKLIHNQAKLLKKLDQQKFPVFTVVNNNNQILIAEPPEKLVNNYNFIDRLHCWYNSYFGKLQNHKPVYQSLFFINPQDAMEYKIYIENQYKLVSPNTHFYLMTTKLNDYYQLANSLKQKVQLCLIPDLKELGELIYKHQYSSNISFHVQQKYAKYAFQGQPIYFIKPTSVKDMKKNQLTEIKYNITLQNGQENIDTVFMNYNTALLAWKKFIHYNKNYKLPNTPQILVYNLEDYLNAHLSNLKNQANSFLFVPSKDSYVFLKSNLLLQSDNNIYQTLINKLTICRLFINKIIWSLTSKQPIN
uniref:hypothetical protein n=1 Tax=Caulacanthus ustulatus TaxID=31411 RepID=UPI0027DA9C28|nr:hypothetical protein REQ00_pgp135 [Caulacanthus ustulatus]WCH57290.1 hypothetical protein [Caulacanthus ustulatus]